MKKNIWKLVALMFAVFTSMTMTSCSDDNGGSSPDSPAKVEVKIGGYVNTEVFDYYSVVRTFDGKEEILNPSATIDQTYNDKTYKLYDLTKSVTVIDCPKTISISYSFKKKEGVTLPEKMDLVYKYGVEATQYLNNGGKGKGRHDMNDGANSGVKQENIENRIQSIEKVMSQEFEIKKGFDF